MFDKTPTIIIIPARGGSKRLPRKNVLPLLSKPLIAWTIEAAIAAGVADEIVVTSDDDEILDIASDYNVTCFRRCAELATDQASTIDVVIDVLMHYKKSDVKFKSVILLQPTSPLRLPEDIINATVLFKKNNGKSVISVCEVDHPIEWCGSVTDKGVLSGFGIDKSSRSQDYEMGYRLNGSIYVAAQNAIETYRSFYTAESLAYKMPKNRSYDIDDSFDFAICSALMSKDDAC